MKLLRFGFLLISFLGTVSSRSQSLYDLYRVQTLHIHFPFSNWDFHLDTAKYGANGYVMADSVSLNGVRFDSVGVQFKGNSSYDSSSEKNPFHIELNTWKKQNYQGFTDIKLSNAYADPSFIREVLSYTILSNYMDCPRANFLALYINGEYIGIYSSAESINKDFCSDHFYSRSGALVKCNPLVTPGPTVKSNLKFITSDSTKYFNNYELKSNSGWNQLVALCDTVTNYPANIPDVLDLDKTLWMLAFNNLLINLDSYTGAFAQNYYLYRDERGVFNPVVWDLNMSFGGFPFAGGPNNGMGTLSISNMQNFPPGYHETHADWPVISGLLSNPRYKRMYIAHMKAILNDVIESGRYLSLADSLQNLIRSSVQNDTKAAYSYSQFLGSMTTSYSVGSYQVPGIQTLMSARVNYLKSQADLTKTAPGIQAVSSSVSKPALKSGLFITAKITNAGTAELFYRTKNYTQFSVTAMLDDGMHGDGTAGDGVYGASLTMSTPLLQYYVLADNGNAATFSPSNAAYRFYELRAVLDSIAPGDVVINEFLAKNKSSDANEYKLYSDWIEFYNNSSTRKNLAGYYLSDNTDNLQHFVFEDDAILEPGGFLAVWADNLKSTTQYAHCGFELSGSGGSITLSNPYGTVLDQVTYASQSDDVSMGRCPDGKGKFYFISTPGFLFKNTKFCVAAITHPKTTFSTLLVYPNPAGDQVLIKGMEPGQTVQVYNIHGLLIHESVSGGKDLQMTTSQWPDGIYSFNIPESGQKGKLVIVH